jgi:hypothetical protein
MEVSWWARCALPTLLLISGFYPAIWRGYDHFGKTPVLHEMPAATLVIKADGVLDLLESHVYESFEIEYIQSNYTYSF